MKNLLTITLFVFASAMSAQAQQAVTTTVEAPTPVRAVTAVTAEKVNAEIIASSAAKVVKGAPYSGEAISESVQTLSDGNRITRSSTVKMFRDSEGRVRREGSTPAGGSGYGYATSGGVLSVYGMQDIVSIFDPVDGVRYTLNPKDKTARRFEANNRLTEGAVYVNGQTLSPSVKATVPVPMSDNAKRALEANAARTVEASVAARANVVVMPNMVTGMMSGGKTEELGSKTFEGVTAEGKRTVTTIAAGAIGNERPIEIVYERWYSKELDLIVYSRHSDPRFGEQTYRLVNINRSEPDRSLFSVPGDYKTVAEPVRVYTTTVPAQTKPQ